MDRRTFLLGVLTGVTISTAFRLVRPTAGTLKIDRSNPEKEVYRFEIDDLGSLSKKKLFTLKIDNYADLSQN